jgi:hypothetical protein
MNGQLTSRDILATTRRDTERQPKAITKTCDSCEQPFSVERPRERFCSACKVARRRQQTREAMRLRRGVSIQAPKRPRIAKNVTSFMA